MRRPLLPLLSLLACLTLPATAAAGAERRRGPSPAAHPVVALEAALPEAARAAYREYLLTPPPRAFAVSASTGAFGWSSMPDADQAAARRRAMELCARNAASGPETCRVAAADLEVQREGRPPVPEAAPDRAELASGDGWRLVLDGRFLPHGGPGRARGVVLWTHGSRPRGAKPPEWSAEPQPFLRALNNAGWEIARLDRDPQRDWPPLAMVWTRDALRALRARGWARVVASGQSRGGWAALEALQVPGLVDAVLAVAPAAHGTASSVLWDQALPYFEAVLLAAERAPRARVAVALFDGDPYDPGPGEREEMLRRVLGPKVGALMVLRNPAGVGGHDGGIDPAFTRAVGPCWLEFVEGRARGC